MDIKSADMIIFSPTDTTRIIVTELTKGLKADKLNWIDLTKKWVRDQENLELHSDIVIIGVPVYGARMYKPLRNILIRTNMSNKLAVVVSLYGNVSYGVAHYELSAICSMRGAKVIAVGMFIGEHTYSTPEVPIAENRPNEEDRKKAFEFGDAIREKLNMANGNEKVRVPKIVRKQFFCLMVYYVCHMIPKQHGRFFVKSPDADMSKCIKCGKCVAECPMQVISGETYEIEANKCIRCYACVKKCPVHARRVKVTVPLIKIGLRRMSHREKQVKYFI